MKNNNGARKRINGNCKRKKIKYSVDVKFTIMIEDDDSGEKSDARAEVETHLHFLSTDCNHETLRKWR